MVNSPLRYPGGKSIMTDFLNSFINENDMKSVIYAEPYAGGVGAGINLLLDNKIKRLFINDANIAVYAFWHSLINHPDRFLELFEQTPITLNEWHSQKSIFSNFVNSSEEQDLLPLGFATFFLNRSNRSGILKAGAIGGNSSQSQALATYKIDARFKKELLRNKLLRIIEKRKYIEVFNYDALYFLKYVVKTKTSKYQSRILVYMDPPYFCKGSGLYLDYYTSNDHINLANYLNKDTHFKWILSYDNDDFIKKLYSNFSQYSFDLNYRVEKRKVGSELLLHSKNSILPPSMKIQKKYRRRKEIALRYVG